MPHKSKPPAPSLFHLQQKTAPCSQKKVCNWDSYRDWKHTSIFIPILECLKYYPNFCFVCLHVFLTISAADRCSVAQLLQRYSNWWLWKTYSCLYMLRNSAWFVWFLICFPRRVFSSFYYQTHWLEKEFSTEIIWKSTYNEDVLGQYQYFSAIYDLFLIS